MEQLKRGKQRHMTVHRIIEEQASRDGDRVAIADADVTLSYRQLNQRANAFARYLVASGFRRGSLATVRLERSPDAAIVLLGILKAGGKYSLIDDDGAPSEWPGGVCFQIGTTDEECRQQIDVSSALALPAGSVANLPILARGEDIACVLQGGNGSPQVLVPHATIASLQLKPAPRIVTWTGEPGALDLWMALMTGATVALDGHLFESAA